MKQADSELEERQKWRTDKDVDETSPRTECKRGS